MRNDGGLQALVAGAGLALVGSTYRLWGPPAAFPQVPLFAWGLDAPGWSDAAGGLVLVAALAGVVVGRWKRGCWIAFLLAAAAMVVLDQQRWQPWLWEFAILAALFAVAPSDRVLPLARLVVISLYLHSAIGKLDRSFLETHGPQLVDGLLANFGLALPPRGAIRTFAAALLPVGELAAAVLLAYSRTRRIGLWLTLAMHAALLLALGPWGLHHKPSVLLWNAYFLAQNWLLFGYAAAQEAERGGETPQALHRELHWRERIAVGIAGSAAAFPALAWFGLIDPWLGWELYSSRPAHLAMFVDAEGVARLPADLQPFVEPPAPLDRWRRVRIDRWSLEALSAPLAPQLRFQVGIALAIARQANLQDAVRIEIESAAGRLSGRRTRRVVHGEEEVEALAREFHLNAEPRRRPVRHAALPPVAKPPRMGVRSGFTSGAAAGARSRPRRSPPGGRSGRPPRPTWPSR